MKRLSPILNTEFAAFSEHEKLAAIEAVSASFATVRGISTGLIFSVDLNPEILARKIRKNDLDRPKRAGLDRNGQELYERLLTECCLELIQWISEQPYFGQRAQVELVRRTGQLASNLDEIKGKIEPLTDQKDQEFTDRYLIEVVDSLNRLELFGVTLSGSAEYQMDTAYLSLSVSCKNNRTNIPDDKFSSQPREQLTMTGGVRVEYALAPAKRVLLRGDAGSGKTTLLSWLAVRSARKDFPREMRDWNGLVPFFLPLRRFVQASLPAPEMFLSEIGGTLAGSMPSGWVHRILGQGYGMVLIDGVDELPPDQRPEIRRWLRRLITTFPNCRYVVTSRPSAADEEWLISDQFTTMGLLPMSLADIGEFIRHWHQAVSEQCRNDREKNELARYEAELFEAITARRHLRQLATNPLLAALLCALNRDRRQQLPQDRMGLYAAAMEMLLVRRDAERRIRDRVGAALSQIRKQALLARFSYWLLRNGRTDASWEEAITQVSGGLERMRGIEATAEEVFGHLLDRSGLLRAPIEGRVDFVHRTFQEYLGAQAALAANDVDALIQNAHQDTWHETVVMAVGHARAERESLLSGLLARGIQEPEHRTRLHLLAAACLETASELDPALYTEISKAAALLVPPSSMAQARELANAGELAIGLLRQIPVQLTTVETAATIRTAALVGGDQALDLITRHRTHDHREVLLELIQAWPSFSAEEYARRVLADLPLDRLRVDHSEQVEALHCLPNLSRLICQGDLDLSLLSKLPALRELTVLSNPLYSGLNFLREMYRLEFLDLDVHTARDWAPLAGLPRLRGLRISPLTTLSELPPLPRITSLGVCLEGGSLDGIEWFIGLSQLEVAGFPTDSSVQRLTKLPNLSRLKVSAAVHAVDELSIGSLCPIEFPPLPRVTELHLSKLVLAGGLEQLSKFRSLSKLYLDRVESSDSPGQPLDLSPLDRRTDLTVMIRTVQDRQQ